MSSYTLNIQVEGGNISADYSLLTADSIEYIIAAFNFDESWTDLYKTAVFRVGELVYHSPLEDDACKIPYEVLKEPIMYLSVFGVSGNIRATTAELPIQVQNSGYTICEPSAPTPDPYNYFLERVTELKNEAVASATQSTDSAAIAKSSADKAVRILNTVEEAKQNTIVFSEAATDAAVQSTDALNEVKEQAQYISDVENQAEQSAIIASEAADRAQTAVMNEIENHNNSENDLAHPNILAIAENAKSIALGKANSLCFDTEAELIDWVAGLSVRTDGKTTSDLKIGDNLYVLELGVPDYWWDGNAIQPLGAEKPDFSDFYTKAQIDARLSNASFELISLENYDALYSAGMLDAGKIYLVF